MEGFANLQFHFLSRLDALFFAFANNNFILDGIDMIRKIRNGIKFQLSKDQRRLFCIYLHFLSQKGCFS